MGQKGTEEESKLGFSKEQQELRFKHIKFEVFTSRQTFDINLNFRRDIQPGLKTKPFCTLTFKQQGKRGHKSGQRPRQKGRGEGGMYHLVIVKWILADMPFMVLGLPIPLLKVK